MNTSHIPHDQRAIEVKPVGFTLWLSDHISEEEWDKFDKEQQDAYITKLVLENNHRLAIVAVAQQIPRIVSPKDAKD